MIDNNEYVCDVCGKRYSNLDEYAACVARCAAKEKNKRYKEERERKEREKSTRLAELREVEQHYVDLRERYIKDYGAYSNNRTFNLSNSLTDILDVFLY